MEDLISLFDCDDCLRLNDGLAAAILDLRDEDYARRSHWFQGRYENLYIDVARLPGLELILQTGLSKAATRLAMPEKELKLGFWLNIMRKGDVTTLHRHDDDDELLSAVYYVQADEHSALFRLHAQGKVKEVIPVAGRFMFFDPALPHEVLPQRADQARISIGINFGPAIE